MARKYNYTEVINDDNWSLFLIVPNDKEDLNDNLKSSNKESAKENDQDFDIKSNEINLPFVRNKRDVLTGF